VNLKVPGREKRPPNALSANRVCAPERRGTRGTRGTRVTRVTRLTRLTGGRRCEQPGSHGPTPGVGGSKRRRGNRVVGTGATSAGTLMGDARPLLVGARPSHEGVATTARPCRFEWTARAIAGLAGEPTSDVRRPTVGDVGECERRHASKRFASWIGPRNFPSSRSSSYTLTSTRRVANIRIQDRSVRGRRRRRID